MSSQQDNKAAAAFNKLCAAIRQTKTGETLTNVEVIQIALTLAAPPEKRQ